MKRSAAQEMAGMMLTDEEVRKLVDATLSKSIGRSGFIGSQVRSDVDHDGEPALFVIANFKSGPPAISASESIDARDALSDALLERGDRRFPYVTWSYPGAETASLNDLQRRMRYFRGHGSARR